MRKLMRALLWISCVGRLLESQAEAADLFVSLAGQHHPPFATWIDAATNIQDAIDAAAPGDVVWVTNGIYSTGGKVVDGDLLNRAVLDKALTVQSVNGPAVTFIRGGGPFGPRALDAPG